MSQKKRKIWVDNVPRAEIGTEFTLAAGVETGKPIAFQKREITADDAQRHLEDAGKVGVYKTDPNMRDSDVLVPIAAAA